MPEQSPLQEVTSWVLDLVQIAFYSVVGILTYLTYKHAVKTILQPIKAETYKEQIRILTLIAECFCGYDETQLCARAGLHDLVNMNAQKLQDDFIRDHSKNEIDPESRLYAKSNCAETIINRKSPVAAEWVLLRNPSDEVSASEHLKGELRSRDWSSYVWEEVLLPKTFVNSRDRVSAWLRHPLLPQGVRKAMSEYETAVTDNILALQGLLTESGRELNDRLRRDKSIKLHSHAWIVSRFGQVTRPLLPPTELLCRSIRDYMKADDVMS